MKHASKPRILVVEDESIIAWEISDLLARTGYAVVGPARSIGDALRLLSGEAVDAALVDLNLHGEPGSIVADALEQRGIPFALVTAYADRFLPERHADRPLIPKPYEIDRLLAAAAELTGRDTAAPKPARRAGSGDGVRREVAWS